jgi:hypothetical protein
MSQDVSPAFPRLPSPCEASYICGSATPPIPTVATSGSTSPECFRSRRANGSGSKRGSAARPTCISSGSAPTPRSRRSTRGNPATGTPGRNGRKGLIASTYRQKLIRPGRSRPGARESRRCSCSFVRKAHCHPARRESRQAVVRARVSSSVLIKEAVWLENGRESTLDPHDRALPSTKTRKSDDPVLRIHRLLSDKVQPLGDYYQAIVFPSQGGT